MVERLDRLKSVEGMSASVKHADPVEFYDALAKTSKGLNTWNGELYFELHRGTYTSHGKVKKGNRKSEYLLRNVELLYSLALLRKVPIAYPKDELDRLWKLLLL
jgi:alpha-mannosidase